MRPLLPKVMRRLVTGRNGPFTFDRQPVVLPQRPPSLNLYIHLPFCRQLCAFCPYLKELYDPSLSAAYQKALLRELEGYRQRWGEINTESVYFGGGTPSLTPEIIETTMSWLARNCHLGGEVGAEVHPMDVNPALIHALKDSGVNLVSLGVQSFNNRLLKLLGRNYDVKLAEAAGQQLLEAGFDTVDFDLIFAIPTQSYEEVESDIATAIRLGAGQISAYPLLAFAYTSLRQQLQKEGMTLPHWWQEKRMLGAIVKKARAAGYERTTIWSFNKPETIRYTTVTRDVFIGIGAGASSRIGDYFRLNTFSVAEYIEAMGKGSPMALATRLDVSDQMAYWLFWRGYDLAVDADSFRATFGRDFPFRVRALLSVLRPLGITRRTGNTTRLTERGAYLFHLIEKEYTHAYLETLWHACLAEAWPQRVVL